MGQKRERKLSQSERALISELEKKYDENATQDNCINDIRKVQEKHPLKYITRNFYRIHGSYSDSTWSRYFGTFHEFRRQGGLELSRNQHALERHIAKHASLDVYRKFYEEEVLPFHRKFEKGHNGRWATILVGSDFHDIECDPFMLATFIDVAKRVQPDIIVLNGDIFDAYEFSRFDQDPRLFSIKERHAFVEKEIFGPLRAACPKAQIDLIIGNHENRLMKIMAEKTPALKVILSDVMNITLADFFGVKKYNINLISKLDLDAFNSTDMAQTVKENYSVYFDCLVASHYKDWRFGLTGVSGHTHRPDFETARNIPMGKISWTTTGCMARTRAEYMQGIDNAVNSFALFHVDKLTKTVTPEHFVVPGDFVVIHGKKYVRTDEES